MAVTSLYPVENGSHIPLTGTVTSGGVNQLIALAPFVIDEDPTTYDDDNSFIAFGLGAPDPARWSFKMVSPASLGIGFGTHINSIRVGMRIRRGGVGTGVAKLFVYRNAPSTIIMDAANQLTLTTSYQDILTTWNTDPTTGQIWDVSDFEAGMIEFGIYEGGTSQGIVTALWAEIDYRPDIWVRFGGTSSAWSPASPSSPSWVEPEPFTPTWS